MALTPIAPISVSGGATVTNLETAINALIDQRIVSADPVGDGIIRLTTNDGSQVDISVPHWPAGIVQAMDISRTSALNYDVGAGTYQFEGVVYTVGSTTSITLNARDATLPRIDLITGNNAGVVSFTAGTPGATPSAPSVPANEVQLYQVYVGPVTNQVDQVIASFGVTTHRDEFFSFEAGAVTPLFPMRSAIAEISSDENLQQGIHQQFVDTSSGLSVTITLPADPAEIAGESYIFFDKGTASSDNVIINGNGNNISGSATQSITVNYGTIEIFSNGTEYFFR